MRSKSSSGGRAARRALLAVAVSAVLVAVTGAALLWQVGPRVGIWLVPPDPQRYGQEALRQMDAGLYAHGPAWTHARAEALDALADAASFAEADDVLRAAVAVAGGHHSTVLPAEAPAGAPSGPAGVPGPSVAVADGIATAVLPALDAGDGQRYAETLADGLAGSGACGVVVDLRGNGGGDMGPMLAGVAALLPDGMAASFVQGQTVTDVRVDGGAVSGGGTPTRTEAGATPLDVPVAVLTDGGTGSAAEQVAISFRGVPGTRSFGEPTAGYASVNRSIPLFSGSTLVLTTGETRARTGELFGDRPIAPDELVAADAAPGAAAAWLGTSACPR